MQKNYKLFFIFFSISFLKYNSSYAFVPNYFRQQLPLLVSLPHEYKQLEVHAGTKPHGLYDVVGLENFLYQEQLHPFLSLQATKKSHRNLDVYRWQFNLNGRQLCHDYFVNAVKHTKFFYVNGKLPQLDMRFGLGDTSILPDLDDVLAEIERYFPNKLARTELLSAKDCWKIIDGEPQLVWEVQLKRGTRRWFAQADAHKVHRLINNDLHVMREAFVYYPNINEKGEIVSIDTDTEGFLHNCCFHSLPYGREPLQVNSESVRFYSDDTRYAELASYVFANRMLEFFQKLGYQWQDSHPLQLSVHAQNISTQQLSNNASYEPANTTRGARILIADGDNYTLQNLALDFDVVAHEFSHHVVYRTLKARHEQAIALHEGLADYFTYAASGDSCLGESICPLGSPTCHVDGQCLRTADNDLQIEEGQNQHSKGQVISALLWDLHEQWGMPAATVLRIVFDTVALLGIDSDFRAFALTLLHVALLQGSYSCAVISEFNERGMLHDLDCENFQPNPRLTEILPSGGAEERIEPSGCAVVGAHSNAESLLCLLLVLPLLAMRLYNGVRGTHAIEPDNPNLLRSTASVGISAKNRRVTV